MKDFDEYFSFHSIVEQLAIQRAKLTFFIHKNSYLDPFFKGKGFQIGDELKQKELDFLKTVLPPRNKWSRPNSYHKRNQFKSTIELNQDAIKNRVYEVHRRFVTGQTTFLELPVWYQNLRKFIFDLRLNVDVDLQFAVKKPFIFPAKKDPADRLNMDRRPLAKFYLRDRVVLGLTNKYLTKIFDKIFLDCSFAFRSGNSFGPGPTYHDAVKMLKEFRLKHTDGSLYVSECDIKKFFDCVEHEIILTQYNALKTQLIDKGYNIDQRAERVFWAYLACYSFNGDVEPKNYDKNYWSGLKDVGATFGWVPELKDKYKDLDSEKVKVGIPQGGALSGLIVNILLHNADETLMSNNGWNSEFMYLRYCDDMVIVHPAADRCSELFQTYQNQLRGLNLIPHICAELKQTYCSNFWKDVKSREVYYWSHKKDATRPHSPWVSFVGYMVNENGNVKIRKKSIEKQLNKHETELKKVIKRLSKHPNTDLINTEYKIVRSFETKLYTMSVGKVNIGNYRNMPVEMCWGAGFKLIEDNKYTRQQLSRLDRSSKHSVLSLKKYFKRRDIPQIVEEKVKKKPKRIKAMYPHSFYSILTRSKSDPFRNPVKTI